MPKTFVKDTDSVREATKIFIKDDTNVRDIKHAFALVDGSVEHVFSTYQRWDIDGVANTVVTGTKEIVEFGVDTDFDPGTSRDADYVDYKFSGTPPTLTDNSTWTLNPILGVINDTNTGTSDSDLETFIDWLVDTFNNETGTKKGTASKQDTDTFRLTLDQGDSEAINSGSDNWGITSFRDSSNSSYNLQAMDLEITSNAFSETLTVGNSALAQSLKGAGFLATLGSTFSQGDFSIGGEEKTATFTINNTSENVPDITGTFDTDDTEAKARDYIKSVLDTDSEFKKLFEHDTDTDIARSQGKFSLTYFANLDSDRELKMDSDTEYSLLPYDEFILTSPSSLTDFSGITGSGIVDFIMASTHPDNLVIEEVNDTEITVATADSDEFRLTSTISNNFLTFHNTVDDDIVRFIGRIVCTIKDISNDPYNSGYERRAGSGQINDNDTDSDVNVTNSTTVRMPIYGDDSIINTLETPIIAGNDLKHITRWQTKEDTDLQDFTFTITPNTGENTNPYLNVTTDGVEGVPATVVNITMPTEAVSISSAANADTVGQAIADSNTDITYNSTTDVLQTPKDTTISISNPNTLTITKQ